MSYFLVYTFSLFWYLSKSSTSLHNKYWLIMSNQLCKIYEVGSILEPNFYCFKIIHFSFNTWVYGLQKHEIKVLLWLHDKEPVKVYRRYWFNLQLLFICKERALKAQDISFYWREREKEEKKRKAIAKRFALQHGNAIMKLMLKNFNVDRKNVTFPNKVIHFSRHKRKNIG